MDGSVSRFSQFTKAGGDAYLFDMQPIRIPDSERKLVIMVSESLQAFSTQLWLLYRRASTDHVGNLQMIRTK
jgi:hypothetical protein